jgi:hypothetical protein
MSIAELGSLGEFIASIAVVASVIYLATQIRAQKGEQKQRAAEALAHAWSEASRTIATDGEAAAIFSRGLDDYDSLDSVEKLRFSAMLTSTLKAYEAVYYLHVEGVLEEEAWLTTADLLGRLCRSGGFAGYWAGRATMFRPEFGNELGSMQQTSTQPGIQNLYSGVASAKVSGTK